MKITAIKQQIKRQGRYSIFIEGEYSFSLSETALLESKLAKGQELTAGQIEQFKQQSVDDKLYNNTLNYLAIRSRSTWEVQQYLQRKDSSPALAATILNKLSDLKLIDDEAFARNWIINRRLLKTTSRRKLILELRAKRVPDEITQKVLVEDETYEVAALGELIARKRKQTRYQDNQKLMQYLAGQGFSYGDIKRALEDPDVNETS